MTDLLNVLGDDSPAIIGIAELRERSADALATAFYVLGPQPSLDYCLSRPEIAAVLVCPVRHSGGLELKTVGFGDDELTIF